MSEAGACVWTDRRLDPGARLLLRISFARPPEVHEVAARVVWGDEGEDRSGTLIRRYGLRWNEPSGACVRRLRDLALEAQAERPPAAAPAGATPRFDLT